MAAFDTNRTAETISVAAGRISFFLMSAIDAAQGWNDARMTRKSLSRLSDRELDDIGLTRGDINAVAAGRY